MDAKDPLYCVSTSGEQQLLGIIRTPAMSRKGFATKAVLLDGLTYCSSAGGCDILQVPFFALCLLCLLLTSFDHSFAGDFILRRS